VAGLELVHSLYRAHRAVVPATAWHLFYFKGWSAHCISQDGCSQKYNQLGLAGACLHSSIA